MADWDLFWTVPTHLVRWFYPEEMVTIHMLDYRRVDHQNWWIRILLVGSDVVLPDQLISFVPKVVAYEEFKPPAAGSNSNTATILGVRASWTSWFHTALFRQAAGRRCYMVVNPGHWDSLKECWPKHQQQHDFPILFHTFPYFYWWLINGDHPLPGRIPTSMTFPSRSKKWWLRLIPEVARAVPLRTAKWVGWRSPTKGRRRPVFGPTT